MEKLRQPFDVFRAKADHLAVLSQCLEVEGMHIFIGEESVYEALGVSSAPSVEYERVVPIAGITARPVGTVQRDR